MPIYSTNGTLLADGNALRGCCCGHDACVCASIQVYYSYWMIGDGDEDDGSTTPNITHYCTPEIYTRYTRLRDMQTLTESRKGYWSWMDGGACNYYPADNRWKNTAQAGAPSGSGSSWSYLLHAGRAVQEGRFDMLRVHMLNPASSQGSPPQIREVFEIYANLLKPGKITWSVDRGEATGSCSSYDYSLASAASGVFDSNTWGAGDSWALQPDYSAMQISGGWYMKSVEFGSGYFSRRPWTTMFKFEVEAI